jgi:glycosyltransferase involved in cell wall biosynthesis
VHNITIVSAVYPPEPLVSARMSADLADTLAARGNRVTVVCPQPTRPLGADYRAFSAPGNIIESNENHVEIVRLPSFTSPQSKMISRMRESWSFGKLSCRYLTQRAVMPDVLYVNAWPLVGQALIAGYARKRRIPMVLQVMDVYPESLLNKLPGVARILFAKPLQMLDSWVARQATTISVIAKSVQNLYVNNRRIPSEKIVTIPTWQDEMMFESLVDRNEVFRRNRVSGDRFTFIYLGNIGPVAGVDLLVRSFHSADINNAQLLIIGDGSEKTSCANLAQRLGARNILFISDPDARNVPELQTMADVCLLPLKRGAGLSSIPSKLSAYMFSGKPVLAAVDEDSDTASVIQDAACGWIGPPEDQQWLSAKMRTIVAMTSNELSTLGVNGRKFALAHFSKLCGVQRLSDLVTSSVNHPRCMS